MGATGIFEPFVPHQHGYTPDMRRLYDRCIRCGTTVPWGRSVCRQCNPAGLPSPSPSQYHATVFLSVFAVIGLLTLFLLIRA
jgi:hypothetical protein